MSETSNLPVLSDSEKQEIQATFAEAKDFRSIGEKITQPLDAIVSETTQIIEGDPILNVSDELASMNKQMQGVYNEIINDDGVAMKFFKTIPVLGILAKKIDETFDNASFSVKDVEGKIATIFGGFDQSYSSLQVSIDMQRKFLDGIEANLGKVIAYKEFLEEKTAAFKEKEGDAVSEDEKTKYDMFLRSVEFFLSNLVVLIGNLEMAKKRLLIRLDSAQKLSLAMNSSKPIFKTLLSTAVIEISGQKAIDASMKAMQAMSETIDNLSSDLTDKAIEGNKRAEELSSKPSLSATKFIENVTKLKNHFTEIESYRAQMVEQAREEKASFEKASHDLQNIKVLNAKDYDELQQELSPGK